MKLLNQFRTIKEASNKILFITSSLENNKEYVIGYFYNVIKSYQNNGYNVDILVLNSSNQLNKKLESAHKYVKDILLECGIITYDGVLFKKLRKENLKIKKTIKSKLIYDIIENNIKELIDFNQYSHIYCNLEEIWFIRNLCKDSLISNIYDQKIIKFLENRDWFTVLNTNLDTMAKPFFLFSVYDIIFRNINNKYIFLLLNDPNQFYFIDRFKHITNNNIQCLYFIDDKRGTRDFKKFPISILQCKYEEILLDGVKIKKWEEKDDDKLFFFVGTLIFGSTINKERINIWEKYFRDLKYLDNKNSIKLWFPFSSSVSRDNLEHKFPQNLLKEIKESGICHGKIDLFHTKNIKDFKFGFLTKPYCHNDSHNFKPEKYLRYNILPLIAENFDIECLLFPPEIRNLLVVKNTNDILEKIEYFNKNPQIAQEIIDFMKKLLKIDEIIEDTDKYFRDWILQYPNNQLKSV
jgi:hypothetical protein